ncbi:MAG: HlyD family efflux transporter periplasmic adaptor subunit [Planctomycetaceae bacterium]|nr:HlyD family efflux transporter periplasmic adaptor subunit [Planctomycetaceae bacterium]MBV8317750.1 HlyD family efflux transporter periplasmic adaptor subunit [Planctomycetaceae bacterium]
MSRAMKMLGLVVASLVVAYAATACWRSPPGPRPGLSLVPSGTGRPLQARSAPRTDRVTRVHALARLEPAGGLIIVGARPGIRIERVLVAAGDLVRAGQPLAILEGQAETRRRLALAEAQKAEVLHQRAQRRNQLAVERAREDRLQPIRLAVLENITKALKAEDERISQDIDVLGKDPQAVRQREELALKLDQVRIESYKAFFELEQARADQALLDRKRRVEDQALADGGPDDQVLDRQIDLARVALDATTVEAPIAGQVLEVLAHGDEVSSGPLVTLGDLSAMDAVAEVDQADAGQLKEGDAAEVTILGTTVPGTVTRVGRFVGRNQLMNVDPRTLQDLRVLKVTIRLGTAQPAGRFVNMQVEVAITPGAAPAR